MLPPQLLSDPFEGGVGAEQWGAVVGGMVVGGGVVVVVGGEVVVVVGGGVVGPPGVATKQAPPSSRYPGPHDTSTDLKNTVVATLVPTWGITLVLKFEQSPNPAAVAVGGSLKRGIRVTLLHSPCSTVTLSSESPTKEFSATVTVPEPFTLDWDVVMGEETQNVVIAAGCT